MARIFETQNPRSIIVPAKQTPPRDKEHEASSPNQVSEEEHPSPDREITRTVICD
jgi:hypothetical protein